MLNQTQLIGRVGQAPERSGENAPVKFSLATTERFKDRDGNKQEKTQWHNIIVWGKLGDIVMQYVKKGQLIFIGGKIEYSKYEKDGVTKYSTGIIANDMKMLEKRDGAQTNPATAPEQSAPAAVAPDDEIISVDDIPWD